MKKIVCCIILAFLLSSCFGRPGDEEGENGGSGSVDDVQSFFIETTALEDFPASYNIEKTGRLSSTQSVGLNSNAVGKIQKINVKEGQVVKSGQLLATLADNIGNYGLNLQKANNAVSRAKINYDSQKIAFDNQIADVNLALAGLKKNLINLKQSNAQNIERSENDISNIDIERDLARIDLNIDKLDQNIVKIAQNIGSIELNIATQNLSDAETISGFKNTIKNEQSKLRLSLDDIIEFSDTLLGVTAENERENDDFQRYLGARDLGQLQESENSLRDLITFRNGEFETFIPSDLSTMTDIQILRAVDVGERGYGLVEKHLSDLEETLQNSLSSTRLFPQTLIDGNIATVNAFQSSTQGSFTGFIGLKNQIVSFITTYENAIASLEKQIEILEQDIEILNKDKEILLSDRITQERNLANTEKNLDLGLESTITQGNDAIVSLENQIAAAELNLESLQENKVITLQSLSNQIKEAEINASQASAERNKLSIYSPIAGTISAINVDIGQEVGNGVEIFKIENTGNPEVVIGLTDEELALVEVGTNVAVQYDDTVEKASIFSISSIADATLNYKTTIKLEGKDIKVGEIVNVYIPIQSDTILVPLNIVDVDSVGTSGVLVTFNEEKGIFEDLLVKLGKNYDEEIEVLGCENPKYLENTDDKNIQQFIPCGIFSKSQIVTSNVSNFDENKFKIVKK